MEYVQLPVSFSEWIKRRRRSLDLTQAELAERSGCSVFALRKIESGERRPSKQLAELLARSLDIPPGELKTFLKVARGELNQDKMGLPVRAEVTHPPIFARPPSPVNLPAALTPLVGRKRELAALCRRLSDPHCRLLTLTGPGGIGKTRLSVAAACQSRDLFPDGVYFVPLAALNSGAFLIPAFAEALGLSFQGQIEPRLQLLHSLRIKKALLLLDSAEHLIGSLDLLKEILERAPEVKLLVTSRERLNWSCEQVFEIQGLPHSLPGQPGLQPESSAERLFVQAAQRANVDFELRPEERPFIIRICQILEGLPLGIELAAAWVPVLSCREIAQEIERNLDFLAFPQRNKPERQRSLRAAFDHSWNLLSEVERRALSRLAVFKGDFNREAAEQVAGTDITTVLALVSKSLVRRRGGDRYHLPDVLRQYAFTRLCNDPTEEPSNKMENYGYRTVSETHPLPGSGRA